MCHCAQYIQSHIHDKHKTAMLCYRNTHTGARAHPHTYRRARARTHARTTHTHTQQQQPTTTKKHQQQQGSKTHPHTHTHTHTHTTTTTNKNEKINKTKNENNDNNNNTPTKQRTNNTAPYWFGHGTILIWTRHYPDLDTAPYWFGHGTILIWTRHHTDLDTGPYNYGSTPMWTCSSDAFSSFSWQQYNQPIRVKVNHKTHDELFHIKKLDDRNKRSNVAIVCSSVFRSKRQRSWSRATQKNNRITGNMVWVHKHTHTLLYIQWTLFEFLAFSVLEEEEEEE